MKKRTRRILIAGLAAVFAVSLGVVVCPQLQYGKNDRAIDDARRLAGVPAEGKSAVRRPQSASEETEEETDPWADIDLEALREVNEDVAGWLAIPGTDISYPLIRPQDNETYVHRIGRTARAQKEGLSYLFYSADERTRLKNLIRYTRFEIAPIAVSEDGIISPAEGL